MKRNLTARRFTIFRAISGGFFVLLMFGTTPMLALADSSSAIPGSIGGSAGTPVAGSTGGTAGNTSFSGNQDFTATTPAASTAAGVGGCAAGLLASILNQIGFSVAGATLGRSTSEAGKAAAAGAAAGGIAGSAVAVPTTDTPTHLGVAANTLSGFGDSISNAMSAIANNQSLGIQSQQMTNSFLGCIARSIARALLQQITVSTVNWINSGFNGSPSFLTDPTQFFENTANTAAGNYLAGSDLAFLCSPFSLQVKIAIAQAYTSNNALSCNLIGNFQNFMSGFQNGGWPSMLSLTTSPNNNPFGAFISGQAGLNAAVANAQNNVQNQLQLSGGFLDFQEPQNCTITNSPPSASPSVSVTALSSSQADTATNFNGNQDFSSAGGTAEYRVCNLVTVTPGKVISDSLSKVLGTNIDSLNAVYDFDQIISALITQLIQRTLYGGLLNLGGTTGNYGNTDTGVNSIAALQNDVLANVPSYLQSADQAESIYQQDVNAIAPVASSTASALTCLQNASGYANLTADQQSTVSSDLPTIQSDMTEINGDLTTYGSDLANAQSGVSLLNQFQNESASMTDADSLETLAANFTAAISNSDFPDQDTVNGAEEDEQTLSVNIGNIEADVAPALSACEAMNVPEQSHVAVKTPAAPKLTGPAPSCTITVSPTSVVEGNPVTVSWTSENATQGTITPDIGSVGASGSAQDDPYQGVTGYSGSFNGPGGSGTCSTTVTVFPAPIESGVSGGGL
ncbi:MAG: hypothetical protein ACREGH_01415 [Minisyncoccia bacterium]